MMNNSNAEQQYLSLDCDGSFLAFLYADEDLNFYSKSAFKPKYLPTSYTHSQTHILTSGLGRWLFSFLGKILHVIICKFKAYSVLLWNIYIL